MKNFWARSKHSFFILSLVLILSLMLSACGQTIPETGSDGSQVSLEMSESAITAPASITAGIATFSLINSSQTDRSISLGRLNTGVTVEQFMEQLATNDLEAVSLVSLAGGRDVPAGQSEELVLEIEEGTYIALAFPESDGPPLTTSFMVSGTSDAVSSPPTADVKVDMADFTFVMPDTLEAGESVWEINNSGQQWHELFLVKPSEGLTQEQFMEMFMSEEPPDGEPPFEEIGFFGPSSQGERGWVTFSLEPGTYWALCFLPDVAGGGESHLVKGMFKEFTVR